MGRTTTYRVENLPTGDKQMTNTSPDGAQIVALLKTDGTQYATTKGGTAVTSKLGPDPRFGMQAPVLQSLDIQTPGGLTYSLSVSRSVSLSDANNPLSLTSLTDNFSVNSRTYQSQYTAATRKWVSTTPQGRQTVTTVDVFGRLVKREMGGIEPIALTYDANGKMTKISQGPEGSTRDLTLAYNPGGYLSSLTDPLSRTMGLEYDQAGRLTRQVLPGGQTVSYVYDAYGNLTSITPPGRPAHVFSYTPIDKVEEYLPPPVGPGTGQTTYTYNADRQLTTVTRPDGRSISLAYDAGGRLSSRTILRGATGYAYDAQTGKLASITSPDGGVLSFTYDGSLVTGMAWQGTIQGILGVTYDNNFLVAAQSVNGGNTVNFSYDNDGLLTQVGDLTIDRSTVNGRVTGTSLGQVTDIRSYNTFGELSDYSAAANASPIFSAQYTRDKLGRIIEKSETVGGVSKVFSYSYNLAGRLVEVKEGGTTIAAYTYDGNGNRLSYAGTGGTTTYTYDIRIVF